MCVCVFCFKPPSVTTFAVALPLPRPLPGVALEIQCQAAFERGEAEKLLKIKASEADAEAKRLAGVGMANMRAAMAQGFQDVVGDLVGGGKMMENGKVCRCFVVMYSWKNVGKWFVNGGLNGKIIYKWWISHCHVSLPEGRWCHGAMGWIVPQLVEFGKIWKGDIGGLVAKVTVKLLLGWWMAYS